MSSYYEDDEDLDIHIRRGRAASPVYHEHHRYQPPPPPPPPMAVGRPVYYTHGSNYLVAEPSAPVRRSHSSSHRGSPERAAPAPVVINNIYKEYDDDDDDERHYLQLARPAGRARSRSRSHSYASPRSSREDYELEQTRKELEGFKMQVEREKEEKRIKKEMELKRLRLEKEAEEEKERVKKETAAAIEKYKLEQAEKAAKEKKEKEEREKEYQARIREDLRKSGMSERQIDDVLNKDKAVEASSSRPTYTKMSRRHLSIETLNKYRIDYEFDVDPDYVLIKRWVPEHEQDILWAHTREIRERRQPVLLAIEAKKKHGETEFEFVRKKKHHDRRPSPSPLVTFLAGGRPR